MESQSGDGGGELLQHRLHHQRVERVADRQQPGAQAGGRGASRDSVDRLGGPGDHGRGWRVHRGDHDVGLIGHQFSRAVLRRRHREHPSGWHFLHQPAPYGDQRTGVGQ